jgi:hypothetical protein
MQELGLKVGELVEVRGKAEILATLDERGELDGLPFMPEMVAFCGRRLTVDKLAVKLCDTIGWSGMYRMPAAVHLRGARCDGGGHGGCQAGCLIYWKEAWLKRVDPDDPAPVPDPAAPAAAPDPVPGPGAARDVLAAAARPDPGRFACQATELLRAAPQRIPAWDPRQYLLDVRSGNAGALATLRSVCVGVFNEYQDASRRVLPARLRIRGGRRYPFIEGRLRRTPTQSLDLRPGELVRVRSRQEIEATLDVRNRNRGMTFDAEMLRYCGRQARVLRRVERIIDEGSGRMLELPNPCIVLEDVTCTAAFHRQCPRAIYPYWREIWLERVAQAVAPVNATRTGSHRGERPRARTSGRSRRVRTSRASDRRRRRSRR